MMKKVWEAIAIITFLIILAVLFNGCNQANANLGEPRTNFSIGDLKVDANIEGNKGILDEGIYEPLADEWEGSFTVNFEDGIEETLTVTESYAFIFINKEGKEVAIDFSGKKVTYSGDLPVDESAKILFDSVFKMYMAECEAREVE